MKVIQHQHRYSESAVPDKASNEFALNAQDVSNGTRHSLVPCDAPTKHMDARAQEYAGRDTSTSDASGMEPLHFWSLDDMESSRFSNITSTSFRTDPYHGISIEVNNHSINNQGVVMYHVDIKGPDGVLSTYTIRRRYRAFKHLHSELTKMLTEYAKSPSSTSGPGVPLSPHAQTAYRQRHEGGRLGGTTIELPPLPSAGVWTYLKRHDLRLVEQRKKRFEEILRIAIRHPATRHSSALDTFLSVAPSEISQRGSSYVTLQDYSVPVLDRERESIARKQRKQRLRQGRRQRTASEESASAA